MTATKNFKHILAKRAAYVLASAAYHTTIAALKARKPWATLAEEKTAFDDLMAAIAASNGTMWAQTPKRLKGGRLAIGGKVRRFYGWGIGWGYVQTYIHQSYGFCAITGKMAKPWVKP